MPSSGHYLRRKERHEAVALFKTPTPPNSSKICGKSSKFAVHSPHLRR